MWQANDWIQLNFFANKNEPPSGPVFSWCIVPAGFSHKSPVMKTFVPLSVVIVNFPLKTRDNTECSWECISSSGPGPTYKNSTSPYPFSFARFLNSSSFIYLLLSSWICECNITAVLKGFWLDHILPLYYWASVPGRGCVKTPIIGAGDDFSPTTTQLSGLYWPALPIHKTYTAINKSWNTTFKFRK